jgi:hypothetical protein
MESPFEFSKPKLLARVRALGRTSASRGLYDFYRFGDRGIDAPEERALLERQREPGLDIDFRGVLGEEPSSQRHRGSGTNSQPSAHCSDESDMVDSGF